MRSWQANGAELGRPHYLALLADALGLAGKAETALPLVEQALEVASWKGERIHEAELYRLKGDLFHALGRTLEEVEDCYRQAIDLARQRRSPSMELRARLAISRLRMERGEAQRMRDPLAKLYQRFDEGFETPDLQEASALLNS